MGNSRPALTMQDGVAQTMEVQTQASVIASLPAMDGWRPGDAHLHSNYSADNKNEKYTINYIAKTGKERGLKWLVFTDHNVSFKKWVSYNDDILVANGIKGLSVGVGTEVSTIDPSASILAPWDSHYLAYNIKTPVTIGFNGKASDGQGTINAVKSAGGFGVLAHPFSSAYPWFSNWPDATGFQGIELSSGYEYIPYPGPLSGETKESGQLLKWDQLLWNGLNNTINPKKNKDMLGNFMAGTMNSDGSGAGPLIDYEMYGEKFTYLYKPIGPKTAISALKNGRVLFGDCHPKSG